MTAIFNLSTVAVIWFGAVRVNDGALSIGNLTAFMQYLAQILFAVLTAVFMFILIPRGAVSAGRIREVLDTDPLIHQPDRPVTPSDPDRRGEVVFDGVEFRYPGAEHPVLRDIAFRAGPGETTAIVGSTGSGKSTLVNLIPRFYDATKGTVLVDGVDIRELDRSDLWRVLGVIPQKSFLFSGTVASNLRFGDQNATDDELWHALDIAQARDFVTEMEGGLEAPITQGGTNLSGGQRQRLAIARALVKKAEVYIFDDSFSALDFSTDSRLRAALEREVGGATLIIVAQRVGTIMKADRIVVMDAGRIVGSGTHTELLESNETYREIVYSQLSEAEAVA
jgi:ATP-binding cassette subfamily B protein